MQRDFGTGGDWENWMMNYQSGSSAMFDSTMGGMNGMPGMDGGDMWCMDPYAMNYDMRGMPTHDIMMYAQHHNVSMCHYDDGMHPSPGNRPDYYAWFYRTNGRPLEPHDQFYDPWWDPNEHMFMDHFYDG